MKHLAPLAVRNHHCDWALARVYGSGHSAVYQRTVDSLLEFASGYHMVLEDRTVVTAR